MELFRKSLMRKDGVRVDHVGGLLAETDLRRLALNTKEESCKQGNRQKKALRQTDKAVQVQKRLKGRVLKRPRKTETCRHLSPQR